MGFSAWYSLAVGVLMLAQWGFFLATGQVSELQTEPVRIGLHLAAEAVTAVALIAAAVSLFGRRPWAPKLGLLANGMLFYTVLASPGYYAQQSEWLLVGMFAALLILTLASTALLLRPKPH